MAQGGGGGARPQGSARTTECVHSVYRPPPSAPAATSGAPVALQMPALPHGAVHATTSSEGLDFVEPRRVITIRDRNLDDSYIDGLMRSRGLEGPQMAAVRRALRRYIDSFVGGRGIELDDGAYALLTNMLVYLIDETSRD